MKGTYANATRPRHVIQPPFPERMTHDQVLITNFWGQKPLAKNMFNPTPQARRPSKAASPSASGQTKKQLHFPVIKRGDRFKTQPATRHVVAALNLTVGRNDHRHHARSESASDFRGPIQCVYEVEKYADRAFDCLEKSPRLSHEEK